MGRLSSPEFGRRWGRRRMCFRLNPRRVWVRSLRARFFYLLGIFRRWRTASYSRALEAVKEGLAGSGSSSSASRKEGFGGAQCRLRSCGYSSPFYSEAIADCLEFIKRSSVSVEDYKSLTQM
ncbi:hypothetical protein NMG60_11007694 [Bertholletia excelsa]